MKKLFTAALCVSLSVGAFAQKGLSFGAYVLPQSTWILNQNDFDLGKIRDFRSTINVGYGLQAGYGISDNFSIQTGAYFSRLGQDYTSTVVTNPLTGAEVKSDYSVKVDYLRVPLLASFNSDPSSNVGFLFNVGADFGFKMANSIESSNGTTNSDMPYFVSNTVATNVATDKYYKSLDIQGTMGFGAQIRVTDNLKVQALLRLGYSLMDIEEKPADTVTFKYSDRKTANHATAGLQIGLVYSLAGQE